MFLASVRIREKRTIRIDRAFGRALSLNALSC